MKTTAHKSAILLLLLGSLTTGCGQSQGALLYMLGFGQGALVDAEFQLTEEPILILIDDPSQRIDWPPASRALFDELAQELLKHEAARKIVPRTTLENLRQAQLGFEKRSCREIGELAGATQVLWLEIQQFHASPEIREVSTAAHFTLSVKVINVKEKKRRTRVRLWPISPRGRLIAVSLSGSEVALAKTKDAIARKMAGQLAIKIAKLFYEHRLGDFERQP